MHGVKRQTAGIPIKTILLQAYQEVLFDLSDRHEIELTDALRQDVAQALVDLASAGQGNVEQLKKYALWRALNGQRHIKASSD